LIIAIFLYLFIINKKFAFLNNSGFLFFNLLIGNLISVIFAAKVLHINYPEDRTALHFFVFFISSLFFLTNQINSKLFFRGIIILLIPVLILPMHFVSTINLSYSTFWRVERLPERFTETIINHTQNENQSYTIGGAQNKRLSFAYQNFRKGGILNQLQCDFYPEIHSDFQIVDLKENPVWLKYYDIIDSDYSSGLSLLKRKKIPERIMLQKLNFSESDHYNNNSEFFGIHKMPLNDSLENQVYCIDFDFTIETSEKPFKACFVAAINDSNNKNLVYEYVSLNWKKTEWDGANHNFKANILVHNPSRKPVDLIIYIWNINKVRYSIGNSYCQINQLNTSD